MRRLSFSKFETNGETIKFLLQKYPPNDHQKRLCQRFHIPKYLWSFYIFKKSIFQALFPGELSYYEETLLFGNDYMDLTYDEKKFISHYKEINLYRETYYMVYYSPPSLLDICRKRIRRSADPFIRKLLSPRYRESDKMNIDHFNDLFTKKDKMYTQEFVYSFQRDTSLPKKFHRFHELKIVSHYIKSWHNNKKRDICLNCVDHYLAGGKIKSRFYRCYIAQDEMCKLKYIQNPKNWCNRCKRSPLFLLLHKKDVFNVNKCDGFV